MSFPSFLFLVRCFLRRSAEKGISFEKMKKKEVLFSSACDFFFFGNCKYFCSCIENGSTNNLSKHRLLKMGLLTVMSCFGGSECPRRFEFVVTAFSKTKPLTIFCKIQQNRSYEHIEERQHVFGCDKKKFWCFLFSDVVFVFWAPECPYTFPIQNVWRSVGIFQQHQFYHLQWVLPGLTFQLKPTWSSRL